MNPELVVPLSGDVLDELIARAAATGTSVTARIAGSVDDLDAEVASTAHRIVQEAMTNAFRHAPGAAVQIDLDCGRAVRLDITNEEPAESIALTRSSRPRAGDASRAYRTDIASFPLNLTGAGRGLLGMKERVTAAGGQISWGPSPSGGWYVATILPRPEPGNHYARSPRPVALPCKGNASAP